MYKVITVVLLLFEKVLKYITKNAYIMIAMQGHAFCDAACHAFKLLMTNLAQFVLVSCFSKVVITLGKIMIFSFCVGSAYFWLVKDMAFAEDINDLRDNYTGTRVVSNKMYPTVFTGILAYAVASAFLYVYDLAISSILLCFCEDYKIHNVDDPHYPKMHREVYMSGSLRAIVLSNKDHAHIQEPLGKSQILAAAGVSTYSDLPEKEAHDKMHEDGLEVLTKERILDICKKIVVESDEFLHLHIVPDMLTEAMIIKLCGGTELRHAIYRKNPEHDSVYAAKIDMEKDKNRKKQLMQDPKYPRYRPNITLHDLLELVRTTGHLHAHKGPLTREQVIEQANEEQPGPPPMGDLLLGAIPSIVKTKSKIQKKESKKAAKAEKKAAKAEKRAAKKGGNRVAPTGSADPAKQKVDDTQSSNNNETESGVDALL